MGCLTIYTDASYSTKTKCAGYGWWARDKTFIGKGSTAEPDIRCNTYAEIRAIAMAVYQIVRLHPERIQDKPYCTVVTDSLVALEYYTIGPRMHPAFSKDPYEFVQATMLKYNITFNVRKVKAHSLKKAEKDARKYINDQVDALAKLGRQRLEAYINAQNKGRGQVSSRNFGLLQENV